MGNNKRYEGVLQLIPRFENESLSTQCKRVANMGSMEIKVAAQGYNQTLDDYYTLPNFYVILKDNLYFISSFKRVTPTGTETKEVKKVNGAIEFVIEFDTNNDDFLSILRECL